MVERRLWVVLAAVPICLASMIVVSAEKVRPASAAGYTDPTCSSSAPCIEYDNTLTGPGVKSTSAQGKGFVGATSFNSTATSNGTYGVLGQDLSTSGAFDSGVHGTSTRGTGVSGTSGSGSGVSGKSVSGSGLFGIGGAPLGPIDLLPALSLLTTKGGDLIDGCAGPNNMPGGQCDFRNAVFSVYKTGFVTSAGGGVFNVNGDGTFGVLGQGTDFGVIGQCGSSAVGEFLGEDVNATENFTVDCSGTPSSFLRARNGMYAASIVPRSTSAVLEDYGETRLVNGRATVRLDPAFAATISDKDPYLVFLTPDGDTNGLYVANKTTESFQVREIHAGTSSLVFDYRIVAKPANDTHPRMTLMARPSLRFAPPQAPRFR